MMSITPQPKARGIGLDDAVARGGTIGYHPLTSLGPRYRRDYQR